MRFLLVRSGAGPEQAAGVAEQFEQRRLGLGASLAAIREAGEEEWADTADARDPAGSAASDALDEADAQWRRSLAALFLHVSQPRQDLDLFAEHPSFPPVFKVFHGFANQLGLDILDEAFVHHLLLGITLPPGTAGPPVRLVPD